mgnify:FL=1
MRAVQRAQMCLHAGHILTGCVSSQNPFSAHFTHWLVGISFMLLTTAVLLDVRHAVCVLCGVCVCTVQL